MGKFSTYCIHFIQNTKCKAGKGTEITNGITYNMPSATYKKSHFTSFMTLQI
jgi:hypothetical protein